MVLRLGIRIVGFAVATECVPLGEQYVCGRASRRSDVRISGACRGTDDRIQ